MERKLWLGTKVFSKKNIPAEGIIQLREASTTAPNAVRVAEGGWHFGYMGSSGEKDVAKRIGTKVVAAAHQEYNDGILLAEAADRLLLGQDMFDREASFQRVEVDESYPEYLLSHRKEYEYPIMPPVKKGRIVWIKATMKLKRLMRRIVRKIKRVVKRA